jgi:hypothetical protein
VELAVGEVQALEDRTVPGAGLGEDLSVSDTGNLCAFSLPPL